MHSGQARVARGIGRLSTTAKAAGLCTTLAAAFVAISGEAATANRVAYISQHGDDSVWCFFESPCLSINRAIEVIGPGGTVFALDTAYAATMVIDQAVSIVGPGPEMPIVASARPDDPRVVVRVAAPPGALVELSGFRIEGFGAAEAGILVESAGEVRVSDCLIRNVRGSNGAGIRVKPSGGATRVFVSNCTIGQNRNGVVVEPGGANATVFLDSVVVDRNGGAGIQVDGPGAIVRLNDSTVTNNFVGLQSLKGGRLISFGNNAVAGNTTDGLPTETIEPR